MPIDAARAKSLFLSASDLSDLAQRAAYLERECFGDWDLRARVEALLRANDNAPMPRVADLDRTGAFLPNDPDRNAVSGNAAAGTDRMIAGKYRLVEEIGEGGMG